MAINNVVIIGRLTKSPEVKQTGSGISFCNFTVAVERAYKSGEERQADFIDCVVWRNSADFLSKYFQKGDMIGVTGHLQTRNWETDDGQRRKTTEVVADSLSFVGSKKASSKSAETAGMTEKDTLTELVADDDDIPF